MNKTKKGIGILTASSHFDANLREKHTALVSFSPNLWLFLTQICVKNTQPLALFDTNLREKHPDNGR